MVIRTSTTAVAAVVAAVVMVVAGPTYGADPGSTRKYSDYNLTEPDEPLDLPPNDWMTAGGETIPEHSGFLEIAGGSPTVDLRMDFGVTSFMQIGIFGSYDYMVMPALWADGLETMNYGSGGLRIKFNLFRAGRHALSLTVFNRATGYGGSVMTPDIRYSYRSDKPKIALIAGARCPAMLTIVGFWAPVYLVFGFEVRVFGPLSFHVLVEPGLIVTTDDDTSEKTTNALLGIDAGFSVRMW